MTKSLNLATMLAVAGGLTMAIAPTTASATCAPISRSSCGACSAKPKKVKKAKVAKAGCCAAAPCSAKKGCCAAKAPKAGCCAAKCGPKA
jgi:Na+(H+)/acetate symporter ActP